MKTGSILVFGLLLLTWPSHGSGPMVLHNFHSDRDYSDRHDYEPSREQSDSHSAFDFAKEVVQGAGDMLKAYTDMREANYIGADKYFHARGNHEAAERGPGGKWAAEVISDVRECLQGSDKPDSIADQEANKWGREGGDPNKYRPEGLPENY